MRQQWHRLASSRLWKSIFRTGFPTTNLGNAQIIFNNLLLHIHPVKIRRSSLKFSNTFGLGVLSFGLFLVLTATGVMLMLYYHPSTPQAYRDMKDLEFVVSNGLYLRNMHRWAAHAMVAIVFLHMVRVFFKGAYRPPKEFNWVIGVFLFLGTLLLSYTGYLLPWDQLAYWAVQVGTNMARATPVFGEYFRFLLLGGNTIGENALVRFYVLHCMILPIVLFAGIGVHFWRIRKDGGLAASRKETMQQTSVPPLYGSVEETESHTDVLSGAIAENRHEG